MICKLPQNNTSKYHRDVWFTAAAAATLAAGAIGAWLNKKNTDKGVQANLQATRETNETNLQLARETNEWNRQMWEDTNEYNTTANQLARWRDAGLSPNSFASQASPVAADTMQSADLANQQAPQVGEMYAELGHSLQDNLLATNQQAQEYAIRDKQLQLEERKVDLDEKRLGLEAEKTQKYIDHVNQQIDNLKSEKKLTDEQANLVKTQAAETQKHIDLMNETINEVKENVEAKRISNDIARKTSEAVIKQSWQMLKVNDATIQKLESEKLLNYAQYDYCMEQLSQFIWYGPLGKDLDLELGEYQIKAQKLQNGRIEFDLNFDQEHKQTSLYFERGGMLINGLATGIGTIFGIKGANGLSRIGRGASGRSPLYQPKSGFSFEHPQMWNK